MSFTFNQIAVSSAPVLVGILAPGNGVTLSPPPTGSSAIAIGTSTTVSITNGYLLYAGGAPVFLSAGKTSTPATLYAITSAASSVLNVCFQSDA